MSTDTVQTEQQLAVASNKTPALKSPISFGNAGVQLTSLEDAFRFAKAICESGFAPRGMEKPESVLIALQWGAELGLSPMAGLQNIAVVNGRPALFGDAALALVRSSGLLEDYREEEVGEAGKDSFGYKVTVKRRGQGEQAETFTVADAKTAKLWGKNGPWTDYPRRMLKFRARGFVLRDAFGDVLKGLRTTEEAQDMAAEVNVTPLAAKVSSGLTSNL